VVGQTQGRGEYFAVRNSYAFQFTLLGLPSHTQSVTTVTDIGNGHQNTTSEPPVGGYLLLSYVLRGPHISRQLLDEEYVVDNPSEDGDETLPGDASRSVEEGGGLSEGGGHEGASTRGSEDSENKRPKVMRRLTKSFVLPLAVVAFGSQVPPYKFDV
jgi:hypothetical protein